MVAKMGRTDSGAFEKKEKDARKNVSKVGD
jgi:hypothetical protein